METCIEEKKKFEECFKEWLNNGFLTGNFGSPCVNEWKIYERCLNKELEEKNLSELKSFSTINPEVENKVNNKNFIDEQNKALNEGQKDEL